MTRELNCRDVGFECEAVVRATQTKRSWPKW